MAMNKSSMSPLHTKTEEESLRGHMLKAGDHSRAVMPKGNKQGGGKTALIKEANIDECADAFIKRFRHQLHIQRLESIENYEKMLARGL